MLNLISHKKHKYALPILYTMTFFLALAGSLPAYIQSSYLEKWVGLSAVTWFFILANLSSLFCMLLFPRFIKRVGNYLSTGIISIIFFIGLTGLSLSTTPLSLLISFILMQLAINLIWINMDIFVENFSKDCSTGKTRTIYFTIINMAWIVSPSLSALLVSRSDYPLVFLVSAISIIPFLSILAYNEKLIKDKISYRKTYIAKELMAILKDKDLRGVTFLSLLLNIFFNMAVVFVPIYLHQYIGFSWQQLGWMFSLMLIPFILIEIPAGIIADRYLGEKEFFYLGFTLIISCLCIFSLLNSQNTLIWALVLFISRVGAALVEAMRESYFFKKVSAKDVEKINIFRATIPFGHLLGSVLGLLILMILPLSHIFFITGAALLSSFYFLHSMKDTR